MTDLAESNDIIARLGRPLTAVEQIRVEALLTDASASVRNYTRQTISAVAGDTVRVKVRNGRARLPQRPVTAVASVSSIAGGAILYQWWGDDIISTGSNVPDSFAWEPFRNGVTAVDVVYSHGYDPIPDDIIGVVCSIVTRALGRPPEDSGMTSESIAGYSYAIGAVGAAGAFGLLNGEKAILDAYCRVGGQIQTAPVWIS